ncbi:MinD/ParA family ATP-binding protein [Kribbella sp. DT2]|uniref:MinD/ParA family ATP-binding protein n=1 Tax=Kribbella sp. DT2 TaxID=3393427 RepID=UPI003CF174D7
MTGPNWQADMMARLDDTAAAAGPPAAQQPPAPQQAPTGQPMTPPPAPTGRGWGAPVPPQQQVPQYEQQPQQYQQPGPPPAQQQQDPRYQQQQWQQPPPPQQPYQQQAPYYPPPQQQYAPPPPQQQYQQPPYPQYQQPPVQQYEQQPQYQPQYQQQYDPNYAQQQQPQGDGSWNTPQAQEPSGWDNPMPDGGPGRQAYTPQYHDPLGGALPVATNTVGLQHEEKPGGFLRKVGRFAAEAAYIAGASGRMQRDVENIAVIRRPIGIGRMIGVLGPVPQSGTSTVTALLADTIASQRSDMVLAVDAFPLEGKLTHRLDQGIANTPSSRVQLARAESTADAISDVLASRNVGGANQIPISLVDCPAGLFDEATAYVAGSSHAVALVIPTAREDAPASIAQLDQLSPEGQQMLVQKGLVIIAENRPDDPEPVRWLQSAVSDRGLGYVVLPYDAHFQHAWPLRPEMLEPATRRAALEMAARLVERATR